MTEAFSKYDCPLCNTENADEQMFINHMALAHGGLIRDRQASFARVHG